jgi:signal transduction histidine kinase
LEDGQGNLWLSTNNGLSKFNPQAGTFVNYDESNGLQSQEFSGWSYHQNSSGLMFFGGINGLNAFSPVEIQDNKTIPPVVLTSLTQGGETLNTAVSSENVSEITLNWPSNFFEFEFAALSYANSEENEYAYKLEGFDEDWNSVGNRRYGRYTNLPGGTYTLRLTGSNNDGLWNEEGTSVEITIVPPFWATWWFRGLGLLAIIAVVIGGYRLRVRNVEARSRELESQVVSRTEELAALNTVAAVISRSLDLQQILDNALDKTLEIMEVEAGEIYLLEEETDVLIVVAHKGLSAELVAEIDNLKLGEGFAGRVALSGEPLIVADQATDSRLTRSMAAESGFHSLAIVPLVSRAKVMGTMAVISRDQRDFSEQDIELLTSIGDQVGVAVENARLYEQAQQSAVVEERQRLARELHDSISQSLHSSILLAEAGQRLAGAGDLERSRGYLIRLGEIAQQAMKEMRLLVYELRPLALKEAGLVKALQQRLDTVERRAGVEAKLEGDGDVEIPDDVEEALFRIAQQALNNALKHAAPTAVVVTIRLEAESPDRRVVLEVADNGLGFDLDSLEDEGGIGLDSMRERVEKIGGVLTIVSRPGEGTRVKASVPMKAPTDSPNSQEGVL